MHENETLGNYRVLRLVGDGGFARVYLGEHLYLKTYAAIKVPKLQLDAIDLEDFLNEARRGVGLRHPNVLRTLECGVEAGTQPYIIMDYAPGGSIRQRYPSGTPMPPLAIIMYAKQAGAGLQYIHDQGLIHQDIKPGNMLLGSNDEVLLSDFGIAAVAHRTATRSMSDAAGTTRYMAPEQFIGKASPASDQYALAIVIYEWICGSPPFSGDIGELYYKHTHVAPPPLSTKMPMIAPSVEQVILRALAKDPRDRFPNVQDFVSALELAGRSGTTSPLPRVSGPIRIPTPTPAPGFLMPQVEEDIPTVRTRPPGEWKRTTREVPVVGEAFNVSPNEAVIPTVISQHNLPAVGAGIPPTRPVDTPVRIPSYPVTPPPPDFQREPRERRPPGPIVVLLVSLAIIIVAGGLGFFVVSLNNHSHGVSGTPTATAKPHRTLIFTPIPPYSPQFGFNTQHTRYISEETTLNPSNVARLTPGWKMATDDHIRSSPVVANGIVYITTQSNTLYAFTIATGAQLWQKSTGNWINGVGGFVYSTPAISNSVLYVGSNDHHVYAFSATTGTQLWMSPPTGGPIYSSPSVFNNVVYIGSTDHNIYAFNATNGSLLWQVPTGGNVFSSPAVFNNIVYSGSDDNKLYALDAATGRLSWTWSGPAHIDSSPTVVDGMVYVGGANGILYALDANGCGQPTCSPLWTGQTGSYIYSSPAVANGILYIGSGDDKLYAFDTQQCLNATTATCSPLWIAQTAQHIESSPTVANGVVYIGSWDGKLYAFSAQSGAILWSHQTGGEVISSPTVLNGVVYVGSLDQNLYTFHV